MQFQDIVGGRETRSKGELLLPTLKVVFKLQ